MRSLLLCFLLAGCATCPKDWCCQAPEMRLSLNDPVLNHLVEQKSQNPDFQITYAQVLLSGKARASALDDLESLKTGLTVEIASSYIQLRGLQQRLVLLNASAEDQEDAFVMIRELSLRGAISSVDSNLAEIQLNTLRSQRPQLELAIDKIVHRLSALLDKDTCAIVCLLKDPRPLPNLPEICECGSVDCLPEVRKARRNLALAKGGYCAPIPDIYTTCFTKCGKPYIALKKQAYYSYKKAVLTAEEEQKNASSGLSHQLERYQILQEAAFAAESSYEETRDLYERGVKSALELIQANATLLSAKDALIQSHVELLIQYIAYAKAGCGQ